MISKLISSLIYSSASLMLSFQKKITWMMFHNVLQFLIQFLVAKIGKLLMVAFLLL